MKKKILITLASLFVLLLAALVLIPILYKDKIFQMVKDEANKKLNAKVDFGTNFDVTIFKNFPNLSVALDKISVVGLNEFEGDTLLSLGNLYVNIDIMSVISGDQIKIRNIELDHPLINALVLKDGKANWDITKPSADSSAAASDSSSFKMALKKFEIKNGKIVYDDAELGFRMEIVNLNHTLSGDFTESNFLLQTMTTADEMNMWYGGVKYMNKVKTAIKADLDADMPNFKFTFKENEIQLNELFLGFDGFVAMPKDDIDMDFKFSAKKTDFKNFISMVPGVYAEGFKDVKTTGKLGFDGYAKGVYGEKTMPAFGMNLIVERGMFQYPSLPMAVNNVGIDLKIKNPDGQPDHTHINLAKMHVEIGREPFDARLVVQTPVSDPNLDAWMKGKIDLANLSKVIPLEKGTTLNGVITADLTAKGKMSSIEQQRYEEFHAAGQFAITGMNYKSPDMPATAINQMQLTFNPQNVTLNTFDAKFGKSDLKANGMLDNFLAYALQDSTLKGTLTISSNLFDLNEWMSDEEEAATPTAADTAPLSVVEVPANIDFTMASSIGKLLYDNLIIENMMGSIIIRDQTVRMTDVAMNMLDGSMTMSGLYGTKNPKNPKIDFNLDVKGFDIQKTVKSFESIKEMAPIASNAYGKYSTRMTVTGDLDSKMDPVYKTLTGGGGLQSDHVMIIDFGPLKKIGDALKMEKFKKVEMPNLNLSFKFKNGRIVVDPFETSFASYKSTMGGSNGFDQTIDYVLNLEIPRSEFGGAANTLLTGLVAQANAKGANMTLGDKVNLDVKIGGTVLEPKITTSVKQAAAGAADNLKAKAQEEFDKKKKEAEDKARAEADRIKNEAESKAKAEADKLKAEAERKRKEAEDKAKAEADRLKKEAEEKAKNKLKGLIKK